MFKDIKLMIKYYCYNSYLIKNKKLEDFLEDYIINDDNLKLIEMNYKPSIRGVPYPYAFPNVVIRSEIIGDIILVYHPRIFFIVGSVIKMSPNILEDSETLLGRINLKLFLKFNRKIEKLIEEYE